jgi:hypothetical protein
VAGFAKARMADAAKAKGRIKAILYSFSDVYFQNL